MPDSSLGRDLSQVTRSKPNDDRLARPDLGCAECLLRRQQHSRDLHQLAVLIAGELLQPPKRLRLVECAFFISSPLARSISFRSSSACFRSRRPGVTPGTARIATSTIAMAGSRSACLIGLTR